MDVGIFIGKCRRTMRNVNEVMAVANEQTTGVQSKPNSDKLKTAKKKFRNWVLGIIFSFLPLLALPFNHLIGGGNVATMLYKLFCDISIVFVGISFTISALNDFIAKCTKRDEDGWVWINLILLLLGAIIYTVVVLQKDENPDMEMGTVFWINLIYIVLMFILSANKYICEIWEVRKDGNS